MATGLSLHIGLNAVDPDKYAGWAGPLNACEADAGDMRLIAESRGFDATTLLTSEATRGAVIGAIAAAADALDAGDIFFMTMSSHGGQIPDQNGDEPDGLDETWCLYDGELIDDELSYALAAFKAGVRVVVVSDSCHSGSVVKTAAMRALHGDLLSVQAALSAHADSNDIIPFHAVDAYAAPAPRVMPQDVMSRVYLANKGFYDKNGARKELREAKNRVAASVILLSGCQDNQLSMDGAFNGAFTGALKVVWNGGKYVGGYDKFIRDIRMSLNNPTQSPGIFRIGTDDAAFDAQPPFLII
jgi:hypothetical protein